MRVKSGSKRLLKAVEDILSEINVLPFLTLPPTRLTAQSDRSWKRLEV